MPPSKKPPSKKSAKKVAEPATTATTKKAKSSGGKLSQGRKALKDALKTDDYVVDLDPKQAKKSMEVISTGSLVINHLIGGKSNAHGVPPCPGVPRGKIMNLYGHEGSGKCVPEDTLISTPEGLLTVAEIFADHDLSCATANWTKPVTTKLVNWQGGIEDTTHFTSNGKRPLYGLRTFSGARLRATANHPHLVMTECGAWAWKTAKDIRIGDVLISRRELPHGSLKMADTRAYLLGLLLADGYFGESNIAISNDDPSIKVFLEKEASNHGLPIPKQYPNNSPPPGQDVSIDFRFNDKAAVNALYESVGWSHGVAKDKHFGPVIRRLDQNSLRAVLQGYFDCECYIDQVKGEIEVVSASQQLLRELSLLLRTFGILGLTREKKVAAYPDNEYWRLTLGGQEARKFAEKIGTKSLRRSADLEALRMRGDEIERSGGTNFDAIPNCGRLLRDLYDARETTREHHHMCADYMGMSPRARLTYDRLSMILEQFKDHAGIAEDTYQRLMTIQQANYFYDEVTEIEEASDPEPTFDFSMAKTHSFVAEGFVTHNTTIALQTSAQAIKAGGCVCYIDWEHEIVPDYAMSLGVPIGDPDKFLLCQPDTLDEGIAILWTMANAKVDLIVLDSVGAGVPKAYFEKGIKETADQGRVGMNAAVWSAFLPKLKSRITKTGTAIIGISQIRDAINTMGYGDHITVQGGKAWKFFSSIRMLLKKVGTEKASEYSALSNKTDNRVVGAKIRAKLDKCKVSPQQGNEEDFYIRWGLGVDDLRSLIEIGIAHKLVKKEGAWFAWHDPEGQQHRQQGMEKFRAFFDANAQAHKALERQVKPYMASGGSDDGADPDDEMDLFGEESFQNDSELKDILSSISGEDEDLS